MHLAGRSRKAVIIALTVLRRFAHPTRIIPRKWSVNTWLVYSPHWEPPPLRRAVAFGSSARAPGIKMMRMRRAERVTPHVGLVEDKGDIAARWSVRPRLVGESEGGTQACVLHREGLCCLSLLETLGGKWLLILTRKCSLTRRDSQQ